VHPKGPPVKVQQDSVHQQLLLGEDRVAAIARFAVAWSTPDRSDAVRQATVLELRQMWVWRTSWSIAASRVGASSKHAKFTGVPASGDAIP
jgi:hypothetical protein